ncbi:hypothetical protein [Roseateles chitinivorans]|uniref:hypothetical protein n=1 Tax=Roseateles chitinivorans TaxID=2917965 RepID=UPI003D6680D8
MSARSYKMTEELRQRWINEGRGKGEGVNYKGWLTTNDVNSLGNKTREKERLHGHTCHWLSDQETTVARVLQLNPFVTAICDSYPLRIEDSRAIAAELGIKHPADPETGVDINLTTDIVLELTTAHTIRIIPFNIKMDKDLQAFNNIEHAEIERRWWARHGRQLGFLNASPKYISSILAENAKEVAFHAWIHTDVWPTATYLDDIGRRLLLEIARSNNGCTIAEFCQELDVLLGVCAGDCLKILYSQLARRQMTADFRSKLVHQHTTAELLACNPHLANASRRKA